MGRIAPWALWNVATWRRQPRILTVMLLLLCVSGLISVHSFGHQGYSSRSKRTSRGRMKNLELAMGAFNPFTSRSRNTKVRWFDSELASFYAYVESQPLLTHEQELQYGKALHMWMKVVNQRARLHARKLELGSDSQQILSPAAPCAPIFGVPLGTGSGNGADDVTVQFEAAIADGESVQSKLGVRGNVGETPTMEQGLSEPLLSGSAMTVGAQTQHVDEKKIKRSLAIEEEDCGESECLISDEEVAAAVGCSTQTLEKIQRCAEISRQRLVNSNLKLVLAIVSRYRTSSIPNAELIAEGTRGLARAVDRYDYSKGFRFATYATWYVHQAISDYVRWRKHPAKMPSRYLLLQRKVKEYTQTYKAEKNRNPNVKEIAKALDQTEFDVIKVMTMNNYPLLLTTPMALSRGVQSRNSDSMREKTIEEVIASKYKSPVTRSESVDLRNDMERMIRVNLNDVERDVLRLRLGLDDGRSKAIKEVGRRFKISWKQVRSVEQQALTKLLGSEEIKGFVENFETQPISV